MTDNDIIKVLECCLDGYCTECPLQFKPYECGNFNAQEEALDLIKRKNAEIETLKANLEWCRGTGIKPMQGEV